MNIFLSPNTDTDPLIDSLIPSPIIPALNFIPSINHSLDSQKIRIILLDAICKIANVDKCSIADASPLNTLMDFVSLAQLKGMLERHYAIKSLSDEYLFWIQ